MKLDIYALQQHPIISILFSGLMEKYHLTPRESEVIQLLLLNGSTNRELGAIKSLSEKTLKNHIASIRRKFKVNSSRELQSVVFRDALLPAFMNADVQQRFFEGGGTNVALSS